MVTQGPVSSLTEDLEKNINIIRNRYQAETLRLKKSSVGTKSKTELAILYDEAVVNKEVLRKVEQKLAEINIDVVQAGGQLAQLLSKQKFGIFPVLVTTERADRMVFNLSLGKVIILINGTPFGIIAPAVFYDFFSAMDDVYQLPAIGYTLLFLRYIALGISLLLPSIYVVITSFNTEIVRIQLALTIAGTRASVPYPSLLEVLFMLIMMELLTEASIRLPKTIGAAATTVGGLILGQAATEAGLVSTIMIIIVASVAIANFSIPINSMNFAIRIFKYVILFITSALGYIGLVFSIIGLVTYLASLRSFGSPYFTLFLKPRLKSTYQGQAIESSPGK